ncbi:ComF family protein [Patescibacteria group bacterium]
MEEKLLNIKNHVFKARDFLLDLIFPIECLGCTQEGSFLCSSCFKQLTINQSQICPGCKKENKYGDLCIDCQDKFELDGVWVAGDYNNETIQKLIKNLKYRFAYDISITLGNYLSLFLKNMLNQSQQYRITQLNQSQIWRSIDKAKKTPRPFFDFHNNLVIPVPLSKKRLRWRGFNQAESLARVVAEKFGLDLNSNNLIRIKHKKAQAKLNELQRKDNIKGCFSWQGYNLEKRNIILIDDVTTTVSTLDECARILKQNNAGDIWGLVIARG